jgi:hypothetical protein
MKLASKPVREVKQLVTIAKAASLKYFGSTVAAKPRTGTVWGGVLMLTLQSTPEKN